MPWWGWIVIGMFLMGVELLAVDAAFYLIFIGFAAIVTGVFALIVPAVQLQWLFFGLMAILGMVLFREKLYRKLRGTTAEMMNPSVGASVIVPEAVPPGGIIRVDHRGTRWNARNVGAGPMDEGSIATIQPGSGSELLIAPGNQSEDEPEEA